MNRPRIVVYCEGGLIQGVLSDSTEVEVYSIDYDAKEYGDEDDEDRTFDIPQHDRYEGSAYQSGIEDNPPETTPAFGGLEQLEINAVRVQEIIDALQMSRADKKEKANANRA